MARKHGRESFSVDESRSIGSRNKSIASISALGGDGLTGVMSVSTLGRKKVSTARKLDGGPESFTDLTNINRRSKLSKPQRSSFRSNISRDDVKLQLSNELKNLEIKNGDDAAGNIIDNIGDDNDVDEVDAEKQRMAEWNQEFLM